MNAESGSGSSGTFIWGVIAGIAVLAGAGGLYLTGIIGGEPEDSAPQAEVAVQEPAETEEQPLAEETVTASQEETPDVPVATETEEAEVVSAPPTLDQIFVEPDGNALLSGNAEPGSEVHVLLDGEKVHSFTVDPSGQFAEFLSIPFSDAARGLTLEAQGDQPVRSDDYVIAALPAPVAEEPAEPAVETAQAELPEPQQPAETADTAEPDTTETADVPAASEEEPEQVAETSTDEAQDQQVAILRSGEDGVELVNPPAVESEAPEQVALDTIGYSDTGDVELTGRVPDGSVVRLYLDNQLVDDLSPTEEGKWRSELDDIEPGIYTLRVDEVDTDGTVVSRLETPFKREPLEVLRAADPTNEPDAEAETPAIRSVTVQEGDTLWAISRERFGDGILYVRLFEANRDSIRDPDLIYPGQIFTIPE
ncbi:LysM peptidoglycan-binding domain-containing protein [Ruegeria sp.]|uniref:LysM peptidoglycan-binding domain-containing protein n=1 Tax=Ruegeria sp. TaxID=1879320 RepID=UPI003B5BD57B